MWTVDRRAVYVRAPRFSRQFAAREQKNLWHPYGHIWNLIYDINPEPTVKILVPGGFLSKCGDSRRPAILLQTMAFNLV
jgi:hypothetical protein